MDRGIITGAGMTNQEFHLLAGLLGSMKELFVEWRQASGGDRAQQGVKMAEQAKALMTSVPAEDSEHVILLVEPGVRVRIGVEL